MRSRKIIYFPLYLITTVFFFTSCNNEEKFSKVKWNERTDPAFPPPYRNRMLKDLTSNYKLTGLKYSDIIELLGEPNFNDSNSLAYKIKEDYGHDIDPVYSKNLDFTFSKDSMITAYKVVEWKK